MKYFADYHVHTNFSPDGQAPMEQQIQEAIEHGLTELYFTDHVDYDNPYAISDIQIDYDYYTEYFNELQEKYRNQIILKLGVEIGLQPHLYEQMEQLVDKYKFDFVIASTHLIDRIDLGQKGWTFFENKTKHETYEKYLNTLLNNIKSFNSFNVCGHFDYVIRYGNYEDKKMYYDEHKGIIDEIFKTLINKGKGIEINTSGYRYGLNQTHPNFEILKRYTELGGQIITVGSDAHFAKHLCADFDKAYDMLRELGLNQTVTFNKMKPKII